jgi:hypothetical protein
MEPMALLPPQRKSHYGFLLSILLSRTSGQVTSMPPPDHSERLFPFYLLFRKEVLENIILLFDFKFMLKIYTKCKYATEK